MSMNTTERGNPASAHSLKEAPMLNDLVSFASRFNIAPADAYVLPALFERAAEKVGMHPRALVAEATFHNAALGEYLANAARKVAAEDRAN
jgi:hypothetical protein